MKTTPLSEPQPNKPCSRPEEIETIFTHQVSALNYSAIASKMLRIFSVTFKN